MKRVGASFAIAFSMYSRVPMPKTAWTQENMRYVMCFFPLVGVVVGTLQYGWLYFAQWLQIGRILQAAVAVAIPVAVTGAIHLDGFCDTADALASHASPARKREILKDPHTGAFAVIGVCLYFLAQFALWTEYLFSTASMLLLVLGYLLSRILSGLSVLYFKKPGTKGLVDNFSRSADQRRSGVVLLAGLLAVIAAMVAVFPVGGTICAVMAGCVFFYYKRTAYRAFEGVSGDLAGWFLQLCELAVLAAVVLVQKLG